MGAWELPGYDVFEIVGFGSTGEVWRGRHQATGEPVALKRLRGADDSTRERLRREAALVSSAAGEHVIRVRDVVMAVNDAVLVMEFAPGGSLAGILAVRQRLAAPEVVTLVGPLACALADAHDRGIVHGDVTPANIVFTDDGRPLLTDFGVARLVGELGAPVEATPAYAAPEVLAGATPTAAADVYALCRIALDALDPATAPPALIAALEAGLADDPLDRPSARTLGLDVLSTCAAAPVGLVRAAPVVPAPMTVRVDSPPAPPAPAEPPRPPRPPRRRARRRRRSRPRVPARVGIAVAAVGLLVAAVLGGVTWGHHSDSVAATLPPPAAEPSWVATVTRLDQERARAYEVGDPSLLSGVYVPDAPALGRDRTTLLRLVARGLRPRDLADATLSTRALATAVDAVTLRVTRALSAYVLVDRRGHVVRTVAAAGPRTFTMQLRRTPAGWRVADVRA